MYAKFLRESTSILSKPELSEVADIFEKSGKVWSEIATAALPEPWSMLKRIRELSFEKNRIFEEQKPGALEKMKKLNTGLDDLMKKTAEDLKNMDLAPLLSDLQQKILRCYEIEKEAFQSLNNAIK